MKYKNKFKDGMALLEDLQSAVRYDQETHGPEFDRGSKFAKFNRCTNLEKWVEHYLAISPEKSLEEAGLKITFHNIHHLQPDSEGLLVDVLNVLWNLSSPDEIRKDVARKICLVMNLVNFSSAEEIIKRKTQSKDDDGGLVDPILQRLFAMRNKLTRPILRRFVSGRKDLVNRVSGNEIIKLFDSASEIRQLRSDLRTFAQFLQITDLEDVLAKVEFHAGGIGAESLKKMRKIANQHKNVSRRPEYRKHRIQARTIDSLGQEQIREQLKQLEIPITQMINTLTPVRDGGVSLTPPETEEIESILTALNQNLTPFIEEQRSSWSRQLNLFDEELSVA